MNAQIDKPTCPEEVVERTIDGPPMYHWPEVAVDEVGDDDWKSDRQYSAPGSRRYARCEYCGARCRNQGNYGVQCNGVECKRRRAERRVQR